MMPLSSLPPGSLANPPCKNRSAQRGMQSAKKALEGMQERARQQPSATEIQSELSRLKKDQEAAEKVVARVKAQLASAQALRDRAQQQVSPSSPNLHSISIAEVEKEAGAQGVLKRGMLLRSTWMRTRSMDRR